jgi:hypothetical protein
VPKVLLRGDDEGHDGGLLRQELGQELLELLDRQVALSRTILGGEPGRHHLLKIARPELAALAKLEGPAQRRQLLADRVLGGAIEAALLDVLVDYSSVDPTQPAVPTEMEEQHTGLLPVEGHGLLAALAGDRLAAALTDQELEGVVSVAWFWVALSGSAASRSHWVRIVSAARLSVHRVDRMYRTPST